MPGPKLGCGGEHQPACPPDNALASNGTDYTPAQIAEHGQRNYRKGIADTKAKVAAVLEDNGHSWGGSELAEALRRALK